MVVSKLDGELLIKLGNVLSALGSLKEQIDERSDEEDCEYDEEIRERLEKEWVALGDWAWGEDSNIPVKDLCELWKLVHPTLPEIYIPSCMKPHMGLALLVMQIMPHYIEHKNKQK